MNHRICPPLTEDALLDRCQAMAGKTLAQVAKSLDWALPKSTLKGKGWCGQLIETALGTSAGNQAQPDFIELGIELKSLPLNQRHQPAESTYITHIPLLSIHEQHWETSTCWLKLKRVLWLPIEGDTAIPMAQRRIGMGLLWSPSLKQTHSLKQDWQEHVERITCGEIEDIHAGQGQFLQIRPKAANARALCEAYDKSGRRIQTLPRGFYLRPSFTQSIIDQLNNNV